MRNTMTKENSTSIILGSRFWLLALLFLGCTLGFIYTNSVGLALICGIFVSILPYVIVLIFGVIALCIVFLLLLFALVFLIFAL